MFLGILSKGVAIFDYFLKDCLKMIRYIDYISYNC